MKYAVIFAMLLGFLIGAEIVPQPAHAVAPKQLGSASLNYARAGAPYWGHNFVVGTAVSYLSPNNTAYSANDESTLRLLEWGTMITIDADAAICGCVVMDDDATIAGATTTCGAVADPGTPADGIGPCFRVLAGGHRDVVIMREAWPLGLISATSKPSYRSSACTDPAALVGYPCDADNDCPTGAAGACSATAVPTGAFLEAIGASATNAMVTEEI